MIETPRAFSPPDDLEELLLLLGGEGGGGLVEDDDLRVLFERLGDFNDLPHAHGQALHPGAGGDVQAEQVDVDLRALLHLFVVDRQPPAGEAVHKEVLRHRQVGEEAELLADEGDARAGRVVWGGGRVDFPAEAHRPGVEPVDPAQDRHQRGFSRAVLPHEPQHFPGAEIQVHAVEDFRAVKALMDIVQLQQRLTAHRPTTSYIGFRGAHQAAAAA